MNNLALFVCGTIVALISGLGILVYMVSVGYEEKKRKPAEFDADLGATHTPMLVKKAVDPEPIVGIPSVS